MEKLFKLLTISLFAALLIFVGCGGKGGDDDDDVTPETPEEMAAEEFVAAWTITSVTLEGVDVTDDWNAFSLTVAGSASGGSYSTTESNDLVVWPASGTWTFVADSNGRKIARDDGIEVDITTSATTLSLTFDIVEGRTNGITGKWIFLMEK